MGGEGRASVHDTTYDPLVEEPLSGGATILFECPAQIPRSFLRSFSLWAHAWVHIVTTNRPCDSRDSISPSFDTYTNVLNDLTAIFRPIAVFMRVLCGFSRRALHSVELSRTRVAKAIRLSEVQETMFPGAKSKRAPSPKTSLRRSIAHIPCKAPGRSFEGAGQIPT